MTRTTCQGTAAGACLLLLGSAQPASAHDASLDLTASFQQGFLHPVTGVDHLVAMVAVGLLSGILGGRAVVTVPALFVALLLVGGVFGFYAIELVGVESWILGSLLLLGIVLAGTAVTACRKPGWIRGRLRDRHLRLSRLRRPHRPGSVAHTLGSDPQPRPRVGDVRRRRLHDVIDADR
jgi:hypothetical protein